MFQLMIKIEMEYCLINLEAINQRINKIQYDISEKHEAEAKGHDFRDPILPNDIDETLRQLESLRATILPGGEAKPREVSLVIRDEAGTCRASALNQANAVLDRLWDDFFQYSLASGR